MGGSAVVVGGGIGGLAAAIGLRAVGWEVVVAERAPVLADVGAGIS
ncbi:NAD(P)-binding protein, partial [Streptomyces sp. SID625]|nr:NAD(P)-binding protein [Streptomyces sp. SID625]